MKHKKSPMMKSLYAAGCIALSAFSGYLGGDIIRMKAAEAQERQGERNAGIEQKVQSSNMPSQEFYRVKTHAELDSAGYSNLLRSATDSNFPFADNFDYVPEEESTNDIPRLKIKERTPRNPINKEYKNKKELMSDEFFRDSDYLNESEIQKFLVKKDSGLKDLGAAKMIADNCKKYGVNPAVVLAKLQSEQGLLNTQNPTQYQLDYAMGYGDLEHGKKLPSKGLEYQISNGTRKFREFFDSYKPDSKLIDFGKNTVTPTNPATYALYTYTPHTHGTGLHMKVLNREFNYEGTLAKN